MPGTWSARTAEDAERQSLIPTGHIDVCRTGPLDIGSSPPFEPRVSGGWMYGRGAGDMKAGLAANLRRSTRSPASPEAGQRHPNVQSVVEEEFRAWRPRLPAAAATRRTPPSSGAVGRPPGRRSGPAFMWFQVKGAGTAAHVACRPGANAIEACFPLVKPCTS